MRRNDAVAMRYYEAAHSRGDVDATERLARAYWKGDITRKDLVRAKAFCDELDIKEDRVRVLRDAIDAAIRQSATT